MIKNKVESLCCDEMKLHLEGKEVAICYNKRKRLYGIVLLNESYSVPPCRHSTLQQIHFCPWCGTKLPRELTDELYEIIIDELNLDSLDDPNLPEEFKSDEWWRKRNL